MKDERDGSMIMVAGLLLIALIVFALFVIDNCVYHFSHFKVP